MTKGKANTRKHRATGGASKPAGKASARVHRVKASKPPGRFGRPVPAINATAMLMRLSRSSGRPVMVWHGNKAIVFMDPRLTQP